MKMRIAVAGVCVLLCAGCSNMNMGALSAKTEATGSASGATSQGANKKLTHCDAPLGTIAVVEDTSSPWYGVLTSQYHLGATAPVLKLMIQQSNCFVVVDRGRAMKDIMEERKLSQEGELRSGSHFGKGQLVSVDYSLSPSITFSNNNAGSIGGIVGGLFGPIGGLIGSSVNAKEASVLLTLDDDRSGVQLVAAEGSAKDWDLGVAGGMLGGGLGAIGGGYTNTAEGKVIVAAFMDAYNNVVASIRNYKAQHIEGGLGTGSRLAVQGANSAGADVRQAQERLNALGFSVGSPDGAMGPHTRNEIRLFQKSRGLPVTGGLDKATITALEK